MAELWEQGQDPVDRPADAGLCVAGEGEMLGHGQRGEDPPALRDQRHASAGDAVGGLAGQVAVAEVDTAGCWMQQAGDGVQQGGLASAVVPDDDVHGGAAAIPGPQIVNAQHGQPTASIGLPRYTSRTVGSAAIWWGLPVARIRPWCSTVTVSAVAVTRSRLCSTSTTAHAAGNPRSTFCSRCRSASS